MLCASTCVPDIIVLLNLHSMYTALHLYIKSVQYLPFVFPAKPGPHKQDPSHPPALHDVCRYFLQNIRIPINSIYYVLFSFAVLDVHKLIIIIFGHD